MAHQQFRHGLLAVMFLALLALPMLNGYYGWITDMENTEKRTPAPEPDYATLPLDSIPRRYEAFYNDHFPFRNRMVYLQSQIQIGLFRQSPLPDKAIIGRDGWYFMGSNESNSYLGHYSFSPDELERYKRELDYRTDFYAQQGILFYFMVVPCKNSIYPEMLPITQWPVKDKTWAASLNEYLAQNSKVKLIQPYEALRKDHLTRHTFLKLDNHWNRRGAFLAANAALERIHQDLPAVQPLDIADYEVHDSSRTGGNVLDMLSISGQGVDTLPVYTRIRGERNHEVGKVGYPPVKGFGYPEDYERNREVSDTTLPRLLLISDSFGHDFFPLIADKFSRSVKIFDCWQYKLNAPIVAQEKPDVVILMVLEGNLRNMFEFMASEGK